MGKIRSLARFFFKKFLKNVGFFGVRGGEISVPTLYNRFFSPSRLDRNF